MTDIARDNNGEPLQCLRPTTTQKIASTGTASNSTAVASDTKVVRIVADATINYSLVGTATPSSVFLAAGAVEYVKVQAGDVFSVIGTAGVYLTVMK